MGYVPDLGLPALTSLTCDNGVLAPLGASLFLCQ